MIDSFIDSLIHPIYQKTIPPYTRVMKDTVLGGRWLCDEHITFAQAILHDQFLNIEGFQSPLQCQKDAFIPVKNGQATQVHHINGNH